MQVVLVMFRADGERRSFSLPREVTVIGRREDCDLRIPLGDVSRKHCRVVKDGDALRVEDLGSSNGTYHNGQRVQEARVGAGDTVQVGPVVFVAQIDGVPDDDQLQPYDAAAAVASIAGEEVVDATALEEVADPSPTPARGGVRQAAPAAAVVADSEFAPEQTIAGGSQEFDPMDILQSDDDADDMVDFNIDDLQEASSEDSVQIDFNQAEQRPQDQA